MVTLAHSLSLLGCESRIAVFQNMRTPHIEVVEEAVRQGIAVELITCRGRFDYNALRQLHAQVSRLQVQVLHTHGYKADIYGFAATRRNPVNLVATCHNWPSRVHRMRTYAALDRLVLRCFDRVVTPSPVVEHLLLRSGIPRQRLSCIGNGIDLERFRGAEPALRLEADCGQDPLVGFVGRLVTDKGCAVLLAAATTVLAQRRDVRFVFVGEGPSRVELEQTAARFGISSSVIFTGVRRDMAAVYASLNVLVLPSLNEAMPMCLLEAMAAGTPVIGTPVGGIAQVIIPGRTGLLAKPGDARELASAILTMINDRELAARLAQDGRAHVSACFSADAIARRYMEVYQQAISRRFGAPAVNADLGEWRRT